MTWAQGDNMAGLKVDVPEGSRGRWKVERFSVTSADADLSAMLAAFSYSHRGRPVAAGRYTRLVVGGEVVMSDTPSELADIHEPIMQARLRGGHCLINGLGLGVVAHGMLDAGAEMVTAVEIDEDVIELVGPHWRSRYGDRLQIVHADALTWSPPPRSRYTVVWHDIWGTLCRDNLPQMRQLHRKYSRRCDWQGSWSRCWL